MSHLVKSCSTKYYVLKRHSNKAVDGLSARGRVCMPRTCAAGEAPTGVAEVCGAVRSGTAGAALVERFDTEPLSDFSAK